MANVSDPPSNPEGLSKNAQKRRLKEEKKAKEKAEKAAAKAEAAKNAPVAAKATPVPSEHLEAASSSEAETALLPALERDHVQKVYDAVAEQWHGTRYKAWPRVVSFIESLPPHSLVADLGCGNGKLAPACANAGHAALGCDFSMELVRIAALQQRMEAQAADVMAVPYRSSVFDAAVSIAVLHHVSTEARRKLLVCETLRVLRPGGLALIYAWAAEQAEAGFSGHEFGSPDVFVPFHNRLPPSSGQGSAAAAARGGAENAADAGAADADGASSSAAAGEAAAVRALEAMGGVHDEAKRAVVFQRYCHVYREGELRELVLSVGGARVLDEYHDTGNWCVLVQKEGG